MRIKRRKIRHRRPLKLRRCEEPAGRPNEVFLVGPYQPQPISLGPETGRTRCIHDLSYEVTNRDGRDVRVWRIGDGFSFLTEYQRLEVKDSGPLFAVESSD